MQRAIWPRMSDLFDDPRDSSARDTFAMSERALVLQQLQSALGDDDDAWVPLEGGSANEGAAGAPPRGAVAVATLIGSAALRYARLPRLCRALMLSVVGDAVARFIAAAAQHGQGVEQDVKRRASIPIPPRESALNGVRHVCAALDDLVISAPEGGAERGDGAAGGGKGASAWSGCECLALRAHEALDDMLANLVAEHSRSLRVAFRDDSDDDEAEEEAEEQALATDNPVSRFARDELARLEDALCSLRGHLATPLFARAWRSLAEAAAAAVETALDQGSDVLLWTRRQRRQRRQQQRRQQRRRQRDIIAMFDVFKRTAPAPAASPADTRDADPGQADDLGPDDDGEFVRKLLDATVETVVAFSFSADNA